MFLTDKIDDQLQEHCILCRQKQLMQLTDVPVLGHEHKYVNKTLPDTNRVLTCLMHKK